MATKRFENLDPERRQAILRAARDEFTEHGFDDASLANISGDAGISKGSLYYYFEDKVDIYLTVLSHVMKELGDELGPVGEVETAEEFWDDIRAYFRNSMRMVIEQPGLVRLFHGLMHMGSRHNRQDAVEAFYHEFGNEVVRILQRGRDVNAIRGDVPCELLIHILFSIDESIDRWLMDHYSSLDESQLLTFANFGADLMKRVAGVEAERDGVRLDLGFDMA